MDHPRGCGGALEGLSVFGGITRQVGLVFVVGCTAAPTTDREETGEVPREACGWDEEPELAAVPYDLPDGCGPDGLPVGTPPQGGAPFLPLRLRLHADLGEDVLRIDAEGTATRGGDVLGEEQISVAALCANTGSDEGWFLLGELHLRFSGLDQDTLDGVPLEVGITVRWDEGEATISLAGPACWAL